MQTRNRSSWPQVSSDLPKGTPGTCSHLQTLEGTPGFSILRPWLTLHSSPLPCRPLYRMTPVPPAWNMESALRSFCEQGGSHTQQSLLFRGGKSARPIQTQGPSPAQGAFVYQLLGKSVQAHPRLRVLTRTHKRVMKETGKPTRILSLCCEDMTLHTCPQNTFTHSAGCGNCTGSLILEIR